MKYKIHIVKPAFFILLSQFIFIYVSGQITSPPPRPATVQVAASAILQNRYDLTGVVEINRLGNWQPVNNVIVLLVPTNTQVNTGIDGSFKFPGIQEWSLNKKITFRANNNVVFSTTIRNEPGSWAISQGLFRVRLQLTKVFEAPRDRDGDGVADNEDKCPDVKGLPRYHGCPIPDTDGDGVNDEEDKCINEKGPASNFGCPAFIARVWNFKANNKIVMRQSADEANWAPQKILKKNLIAEKIIYTPEIEKLIEVLNPGYKQRMTTETELNLPVFPDITAARETELETEFENNNAKDSMGTVLFNDKSIAFTKLLDTTVNQIKDTLLLDGFYQVQRTLETAQQHTGIVLSRYDADLLNTEIADYHDYYLDLATRNNLDSLDTGYLHEFSLKISKTLSPYFKDVELPEDSSKSGPYAEAFENPGGTRLNFDQPLSKLQVSFYVFSADGKIGPDNTYWIYTLNQSQYNRIVNKTLSFSSLEKPSAKCQSPANVTANVIDMSFLWYIVVVDKNAPDKEVTHSIISAESISIKPSKPEIKERYAAALLISK